MDPEVLMLLRMTCRKIDTLPHGADHEGLHRAARIIRSTPLQELPRMISEASVDSPTLYWWEYPTP